VKTSIMKIISQFLNIVLINLFLVSK